MYSGTLSGCRSPLGDDDSAPGAVGHRLRKRPGRCRHGWCANHGMAGVPTMAWPECQRRYGWPRHPTMPWFWVIGRPPSVLWRSFRPSPPPLLRFPSQAGCRRSPVRALLRDERYGTREATELLVCLFGLEFVDQSGVAGSGRALPPAARARRRPCGVARAPGQSWLIEACVSEQSWLIEACISEQSRLTRLRQAVAYNAPGLIYTK